MGRAHIETTGEIAALLELEPYSSQLVIERSTDTGDNAYWLLVSSPLLADDCKGVQELILDGDKIRFRDAQDT